MCFLGTSGNHMEETTGGKPFCHIVTCPFSYMIPPLFPFFPALHSAHSLNHLRLSPSPTLQLWRYEKLIYPIYSSWRHPASPTPSSNFHTHLALLVNVLGSPDSKVLNFLHFFPPPFLNLEIARLNMPQSATSCPCSHSLPCACSQRWRHTTQWQLQLVESSWEGSSGPTRTWKTLPQEYPNLLTLWIPYPAAKKSQREWLLLEWLVANKIQLFFLGHLLSCRAGWLRDPTWAPPATMAGGWLFQQLLAKPSSSWDTGLTRAWEPTPWPNLLCFVAGRKPRPDPICLFSRMCD